MGQYYTLSSPQTGTAIDPFGVGCGSKAWEQVWNSGPGAVLSVLCATGFGKTDRDLAWTKTGLWAGKMVLMTGDYAESTDMLGNPSLNPAWNLYSTGKEAPLNTAPKVRKTMLSLSKAMLPILERVLNVRNSACDMHGVSYTPDDKFSFVQFLPVQQTPTGTELVIDDTTPEERKRTLTYYTNILKGNMERATRAPMVLDGAPDWLDPAPGVAGLWVSLDRKEYIDPAVMNEHDLAAIAKGFSPKAVIAMIVHDDPRGGGDLGAYNPTSIVGRWRGDRIALVGANGTKFGKTTLTHDLIKSTFTNITDNARLWLDIEDLVENQNTLDDVTTTPNDAFKALSKIALDNETVQSLLIGDNELTFRLQYPLDVFAGEKTYHTKPRFSVLTQHGGILWWASKDEDAFKAILATLPSHALKLSRKAPMSEASTLEVRIKTSSMHEFMEAIST